MINSIGISTELTLNMHALNNEGSEGNQLQTREVTVVDESGNLRAVNAISGDMFKHMFVEHLQSLAVSNDLPLCEGCKQLRASRSAVDEQFLRTFTGDNIEDVTKLIRHCVVDDAAGILVTAGNRSLPRKSVFEVGWVIGVPEKTRTESYFHVKYDLVNRGKGSENEANTGQNIFHRPASSGVYALVLNVDLYRIGQNNISLDYVLDVPERAKRQKAVMEAVLFTFVKPTGAQRNTQLPHVVQARGSVSVSRGTVPAPVWSPLKTTYQADIKGVAEVLNRLHPNTVEVHSFDSLAQFAEIMEQLIAEDARGA